MKNSGIHITSFLKHWWPTTVVVCSVLWLTLAPHPLPDEADVPMFAHADKLVHALMFGGMASIAMFDRWRIHRKITRRNILTVCLLVAVFACADEYTQQFTGRTTDPLDAVADLVGILLAGTAANIKKAFVSN